MWLVVIVLAVLAFLFADFGRYSSRIPSDEEIQQVGQDDVLQVDQSVDEDLDGSVPDFID